MKKSLFIILMVCLAVVGLVSCKNEVEPAQEELIYVSFEKGSSRALTATLEDFDVDDFYWSYEAQKNDGSGLRSGQTVWNDTGVGSVAVQTGKGLDDSNDDPVKVPGFSKGYWNFRLFGYTDAARTKLAYWGEADSVLIDNNHHMAEVTVSPVSGEDKYGYLRIGTITFVPASGISVPTDLVIYTDQLFELEGTQWVLVNVQPVDGVYTLPTKQYKFTRTYSFDGIPVANGSVIATVYSNLTTTVSGTLSELTTYAEFGADQNPDIVRETWGTSVIDEDATGTINFQKNLDPAATEKVASATMPAEAAVAKLAELEEVVGADDGSSSTLKLNLSVDTTDVKQQSVTYDIGMEAVLTYTKNQTQSVAKSDVKNVTKYVLIDINLTSDISDVTVTHSGEAMILTDDMSRAGEQGETDPKYVDINKGTTDDPLWVGFYQLETTSTGKVLHLKTKSFSPFKVALEMTNYVAAIGNVKYTTLTAAIAAANAGDTIIILDNITTDDGYLINKNLSIDTHGYTITVNEGANINNRAFKVTSGKLSVYGGGTIDAKGASGTGCYGAFRAEVGTELYLEGITLKNYRNNGLNVKVLGGTATLKNVTIISSLGGGIEVTEADLGTLSQAGKATLTDCTFTQTGFADWCSTTLSVSGGSELIVDSGSYTSDNYALYVFSSGGVIKVNGGTFSGNKDGVAIKAEIDTGTYPQYAGGLAISGGTFTGGYAITSPAYMVITGGSYDDDPTPYVPEGYLIAYDAQAKRWTVAKEGGYDVQILSGTETIAYMTLGQFRDDVNAGTSYAGKTVKLVGDVDLKNNEWTPIGTAEHPFNGVFDGQNHTIKNLKVTKTGKLSGLFGYVSGSANTSYTSIGDVWNDGTFDETVIAESKYTAVIKNLSIKAANIVTSGENKYTGVVAGRVDNAYLYGLSVDSQSSVSGFKCVGGIVGCANQSVIKDCVNNGAVSADPYNVGGIIGSLNYDISDYYSAVVGCRNNGSVSAVSGGGNGGIVGIAQNETSGIVINCENTGTISGGGNVGGILGQCPGFKVVSGCVNSGTVTATDATCIGGIGGSVVANDGVYNCSNSGAITGSASTISGLYCYYSAVGGANGLCVDSYNTGVLENSKVGGKTCQLSDGIKEVKYTGVVYSDVSKIQSVINDALTDNRELVFENCSVTDASGSITIPAGKAIYSNTNLCESVSVTGTEGSTVISIPGITVDVSSNSENVGISVYGNGVIINIAENGAIKSLYIKGTDFVVNNNGTVAGSISFGDGASGIVNNNDGAFINGGIGSIAHVACDITINNHGTITKNSGDSGSSHTIDFDYASHHVVINNYRTIENTGNSYVLLFYIGASLDYNAYDGSLLRKQGSSSFIIVNSTSTIAIHYQSGSKYEINGAQHDWTDFVPGSGITVVPMNDLGD